MRTLPDGARLTFFMEFTSFTGEGPAQFVIDDWAQVGIRAVQRERARALFYSNKAAGTVDFTIWTGESEHQPLIDPRTFAAVSPQRSREAPCAEIWSAS